jgi:hypothetical protein
MPVVVQAVEVLFLAHRRQLAPPLPGQPGLEVGVVSDCHFAVQLNQVIPGLLSYSVVFFLKRQSDLSHIPPYLEVAVDDPEPGSAETDDDGLDQPGLEGDEGAVGQRGVQGADDLLRVRAGRSTRSTHSSAAGHRDFLPHRPRGAGWVDEWVCAKMGCEESDGERELQGDRPESSAIQ